ncbi:ORF6N domain-containing protein [Acinetobacter ursingii]|uniref:ORF6N domain-containing protein n=1 Tax=Acinetobacter ursingii TaxID=108980 RepID=UPI001D1829BC|nr:ORF6N domain-containing protein [Acinetobacter ursingii]
MNQIANINDAQISVVNFKSIPVVTTEMLADFYGTESKNIQQNHTRNKGRFIEGKHFFKIVGQELKDFVSSLKILTNLQPSQRGLQISPKTRVLTLWTERGAARHAKMLDTDQAWDVFEQLEDCYFHRQEILAKTHKSERTALHEAHALLVAKTKHLNSSDAWKIINQRFGTKSIDEIPYDQIPIAVEYVHHLIALYSNAQQQPDISLVRSLVEDILMQNFMLQNVWKGLLTLDKRLYLDTMRYVVDSNVSALNVIKSFNLKTKQGKDMISIDFKAINFYDGMIITGCNPNYFNAPA